jgi:hypothetical protein
MFTGILPPSGAVILEKFFAAAVRTAAVVVPSGGGKYRRGVLRPSWKLIYFRHLKFSSPTLPLLVIRKIAMKHSRVKRVFEITRAKFTNKNV